MPQPINDSLAEIAQLLIAAKRILALCHVDPDGDAIGSLLGLGWLLRALPGERSVALVCQDATPEELTFLPGAETILRRPPAESWDLIISVDVSDEARLGRFFEALKASEPSAPLVVIDHHITNSHFGHFNYVDPKAAATSQILAELAEALAVPISPEAATCLLAGLLTDTLGFRTTNTTAATLAAGMRLVDAGGDLPDLMQRTLNDRPVAVLRLWGAAFSQMRLHRHVISVALTSAMRQAAGIPDDDTGELVSQLITAKEARVAAVFSEVAEGKVKISLRSRSGYDVSELALALGGGGHPQASGLTLEGSLDDVQTRILPLLEAISEQGEVD